MAALTSDSKECITSRLRAKAALASVTIFSINLLSTGKEFNASRYLPLNQRLASTEGKVSN